jgi:hypothetical protein
MKNMKNMNFAKTIFSSAMVLSLAGCGTIAESTQSDSDLREKAAFALDTTSSNVTILSKSSSLEAMRFQAKTNKGIYNCYFTSIIVVNSQAICSGPVSTNAKSASAAAEANPAQACNALLKAAKRC